MIKRCALCAVVIGVLSWAVLTSQGTAEPAKPELPKMKFDDVKEIAPGVFFRYSSISVDDKYVLDDGTQRVEFLHFGHSHTIGDAVAYLPKHKILCTGDACVNGSFNFMGHCNSLSWIKCLEKMEKLDIDLIFPGHGS